jgi:LemA protein
MLGQVLEIIRARKQIAMHARSLASIALVLLTVPGCGYHALQQKDENVKAAWSEVANQYQRRGELIPNLVRTVKSYPNQELQWVIRVTEARETEADSIQLTPELVNEPQAFARFQVFQGQLSTALGSLFAVATRYPQLQSDANFRDLQVALEGTRTPIAAARDCYIDAVRNYNVTVGSFPSSLTARLFDFRVRPDFTVAERVPIPTTPSEDFGAAPTEK